MKKQITTAAVVLLIGLTTTVTAQAATCSKQVTKATGVNGNWGPLHNTNNFRYEVIPGSKDRFVHKHGRIVGTKCKNGTYKVDYYTGGRDACLVTRTIHTSPIVNQTPKYTFTGVNGNWGPFHNTNNFTYQALSGTKDRFMHKNGRRQVTTKCKNGSYSYIIDHWGSKDACRLTTYQTTYSCPAGYTLRH